MENSIGGIHSSRAHAGILDSLIASSVTPSYRLLIYENTNVSEQIADMLCGDLDYELVICQNEDDVGRNLNLSDVDAPPCDLLVWGLTVPHEKSCQRLTKIRAAYPNLRILVTLQREAASLLSQIQLVDVDATLFKPFRNIDLKSGIERVLKVNRFASMARSPAIEREQRSLDGMGLIGSSPEIQKVISLIHRVAPTHVNVMITGESGSGKEMVASAIHRASSRAKKPFVAINCAAIPKELLESELFGHAKGAFTGASTHRRGLFEEAHEGTILLDEIGDLPMGLQAKILRLIQTRQVKPLGQNVVKEVDVRIVSATHKNLKALIQKGEFREDLYYRLNVMPIHLPPLRERCEDIVELAEYFLQRYADRQLSQGTGSRRSPQIPLRLSRQAAAKLCSLPWKGNVRELENVIERAIVMADSEIISEADIVCEEMEPMRVTTEDLFNAGLALKDIEREYIKYVLSRTGNRKEAATRILGIDRKTLYRKEKLYGIRPSDDS